MVTQHSNTRNSTRPAQAACNLMKEVTQNSRNIQDTLFTQFFLRSNSGSSKHYTHYKHVIQHNKRLHKEIKLKR